MTGKRTSGKTPSSDSPLEIAVRLLASRARARQEIRLALERKGFEGDAVDDTLVQLETLGYLSDERFARDRAEQLLRKGLAPEAIRFRLESHGVSGAVASHAIDAVSAELAFDAETSARKLLSARGYSARALTEKERARAGRLLLSKGFDEELVARVLPASTLASEPEEG